MTPIIREYLLYAVAVLIGFGVYLGLERLAGLDFAFALFGGFVTIHGTIVLGRRLLNRNG
ncbi:hypothetical protein MCEMSEM23_00047 [Rhabdaerophilaceae bacterium]